MYVYEHAYACSRRRAGPGVPAGGLEALDGPAGRRPLDSRKSYDGGIMMHHCI